MQIGWLGVLAIGLGSAAPADGASWVRGRGAVGGSIIDPLYEAAPPQPLFPTVSTGQFTDAQKGFFSQADMGNGALRARAFVASGNGAVFANPVLGETISFNNTSGSASTWNFAFDVDGHVTSGPTAFPVEQTFPGAGTFRTTFLQFAVHIFPGHTVGPVGSANQWQTQLGSALFSQVKNVAGFPVTGNIQSFDAMLQDTISGSVPLAVGMNTFDVVLVLNTTVSVPSGYDSSIDMNFLSTAALSIDSPVAYASETGLFLTGTNNVPEPSAALGLVGAIGAALLRRQKR